MAAVTHVENLVSDGRVLIPNKAAPLAISSDLEEPAIICANFASVVQKLTYNAGVPGHYFHFGKDVAVTSGEPLIAKFKEFDAVIVATKISNNGATYLYGVPVEKLKEMMQARPAANALLDENKWLQSFKFPDPNLESLSVLVDTETDKLRDYADVLISHLGMFKVLGIRNTKHLKAWAVKGYEEAIKKVLLEMEKAERATAAARGARARDPGESAGGGTQAGARWALVHTAMLDVNIFYREPLRERIIEVPVDLTTGKPTAEMVAQVMDELRCARAHPHARFERAAHARLSASDFIPILFRFYSHFALWRTCWQD